MNEQHKQLINNMAMVLSNMSQARLLEEGSFNQAMASLIVENLDKLNLMTLDDAKRFLAEGIAEFCSKKDCAACESIRNSVKQAKENQNEPS